MQPENKQPGFWQPSAPPEQAFGPSPLEDDAPAITTPVHVDDQPLNWQASEAVHQEKQGMWFVAIVLGALVLAAFSWFFIKSITFTVLIIVMALSLIVISRRAPRVINYQLGPQGLQIGPKLFSFHDFRAFGILQDDALYSVVLMPNKRFMPNINVYFPSEYGEHIVDVFGSVLPMEHVEPDVLDKVIHRLHL